MAEPIKPTTDPKQADKPTAPVLTTEQQVVRKAAADDKAMADKVAADEKATVEKREANEKAAVAARHDDDFKFLIESGNWSPVKDVPDTWTNKTRFVGYNEFGKTQSVPDGVTRVTAEAAKLERMRPKVK